MDSFLNFTDIPIHVYTDLPPYRSTGSSGSMVLEEGGYTRTETAAVPHNCAGILLHGCSTQQPSIDAIGHGIPRSHAHQSVSGATVAWSPTKLSG